MHIIKITTPIADDKIQVAFCTFFQRLYKQEEIWLYMNMKVFFLSVEWAVFQLYIYDQYKFTNNQISLGKNLNWYGSRGDYFDCHKEKGDKENELWQILSCQGQQRTLLTNSAH